MIYRIMIVDDEAYIADATAAILRTQSEWEVEVYTYYNSEKALAQLERLRIDILIADICMPGVDGMTLLAQAQKHWPMCQTILLTAHQNFDYAYEALKFQNVAYVLKSDGSAVFQQEIKRAIDRLEETILHDQQLKQSKERVHKSLPWLQREFVFDLISGVSYTDEKLEKTQAELGLDLDLRMPMCMLLVLLQRYRNEDTLMERMERSSLLYILSESFFPSECKLFQMQLDSNRLLWIVQDTSEGGTSNWLQRIEGIIESIQGACPKRLGMNISFVYSLQCPDWNAMEPCYVKLNALQAFMAVSEQSQWLINADEEQTWAETSKTENCMEETLRWRRAYESGDPQAKKIWSTLLNCLSAYTSMYEWEAMELYHQISQQTGLVLSHMGLSPQQRIDLCINRLYDVKSHTSPTEAAKYLQDLIAKLSDLRRDDTAHSIEAAMVRVEQYVEQHLSEDLSLTRLAELVHFSVYYLSHIYKQVRGSNLNQFIIDTKMEAARKMLRSSNCKINAISNALGFPSPSYFSFFFKKYEGITPKDYRDNLY